jgi:hypothetical protein
MARQRVAAFDDQQQQAQHHAGGRLAREDRARHVAERRLVERARRRRRGNGRDRQQQAEPETGQQAAQAFGELHARRFCGCRRQMYLTSTIS